MRKETSKLIWHTKRNYENVQIFEIKKEPDEFLIPKQIKRPKNNRASRTDSIFPELLKSTDFNAIKDITEVTGDIR